MTNVQIIYNPFEDKTRVIYEDHEILSEDNKIVTFLKTNGFHKCLYMFNKKYVMWQGLLPEIIKEVNDDELHIIFEGSDSDFEKLEAAFCEAKDIVNNMGYENNWSLSHISNFTAERAADDLKNIIESFDEFCCETRAERAQVKECLSLLNADTYGAACKKAEKIFEQHIEKWQNSDSKYKEEKIDYIKALQSRINEQKF